MLYVHDDKGAVFFRSVGDHCTILLVNSAELGILEPATPISPDVLRSSSGTPDYHTPSPDDPIPVATQDECVELSCLFVCYLFPVDQRKNGMVFLKVPARSDQSQ